MDELEQKINYLLRRWEEDNKYQSGLNLDDPSFKCLIEIGKPAIPYLLSYLGSSWIVPAALNAISGEDINLLPDQYGVFDSINDAWKAWGKEKGII